MFDHSITNPRAGGNPFDNVKGKLLKDPDHRGRVRMTIKSNGGQEGAEARQLLLDRMRFDLPDVDAQVVHTSPIGDGKVDIFCQVWLGRYTLCRELSELTLDDLKEPLAVYADAGLATVTIQSHSLEDGVPDIRAMELKIREFLATSGKLGIEARAVHSEWRPGLQWTTLRLQPEGQPMLNMT